MSTKSPSWAAPWWFRLAQKLVPGRCREIPEARNQSRILLRQVAIVKKYCYLQQFASSEDPAFMHSHGWLRTFALGLWGGYVEHRIAGPSRVRRAPYFYTMDASTVHQVSTPGPGHTSLFLGLWRDDSLKHYYGRPAYVLTGLPGESVRADRPTTLRVLWSDHIKQMVKRI